MQNRGKNGFLEYAAALALVLAVVPIFAELVKASLAISQLKDSAVMALFCTALVFVEYRASLRKSPAFGKDALILMASAYVLFFCAKITPLAALAAAVFAFGAMLALFLPKDDIKIAYCVVAAFSAYCVLLFFSGFADLPLRLFAAAGVEKLMALFSIDCTPYILKGASPVVVLNLPDYGNFTVATQCNGLSAISSAAILAIFAAFLSRRGRLFTVLYVPFCAALAYFANCVRICIVILLKPHFANYNAMHDIVGYCTLTLLLLCVWTLGKILAKRQIMA